MSATDLRVCLNGTAQMRCTLPLAHPGEPRTGRARFGTGSMGDGDRVRALWDGAHWTYIRGGAGYFDVLCSSRLMASRAFLAGSYLGSSRTATSNSGRASNSRPRRANTTPRLVCS